MVMPTHSASLSTENFHGVLPEVFHHKRKRRRRPGAFSASFLFLMASATMWEDVTVTAFVVPTMPLQFNRHTLSSTAIDKSAPTDSSTLHHHTVKELKDMVKERLQDRKDRPAGLAKLRKDELIDWMMEHPQIIWSENAPPHAAASPPPLPAPSPSPPSPPSPPMTMPRQAMPAASTSYSPRTQLLRRLYQQYPPLRPRIDQITMTVTDANSPTTADTPLVVNCGLGEQDFRQKYHPMVGKNDDDDDTGDDDMQHENEPKKQYNVLSGEMDLIFVGTASCTPGTTRGVSCTALRLNMGRGGGGTGGSSNNSPSLGTWLFDVGEATQLQIQRTSSVRPSKITKIFLTHAHGDHSFGLPGLLCLMGQDKTEAASTNNGNSRAPPIDIYGPEGLRMWLRVAIRYSVSRIVPKYRVHELKDVPMAPEWQYSPKWGRYFYRGLDKKRAPSSQSSTFQWSDDRSAFENAPEHWLSQYHRLGLQPSDRYGEVDGGRDIYPHYDHPLSSDGAPVWEVETGGDDESGTGTGPIKVYAAPMSHGIPCVGYAVHEDDRPGRLKDEVVRPMVERNLEALKKSGFVHPLKAMAVIKNLPPQGEFTFPDNTRIRQQDAVEPPRQGRRLCILGDTASARSMTKLAQNADVVVHEATNTFLHGLDSPTTDIRATTNDAMVHGHSTPHMAGLFAKQTGAKRLILNHFSARYKGDPSVESMSIMTRIENQAIKQSGLSPKHVAAAWDFMIFPIPLNESGENSDEDEN